jgi:5-methylcytosine-specific restriction endonuclease McrA
MRKKAGNPEIEELSKSWTKRSINLTAIGPVKVQDGVKILKKCAWCAEGSISGNRKYCTSLCSASAEAWAYPQKEANLWLLLVEQDWKCKLCDYDYSEEWKKALASYFGSEGALKVSPETYLWYIVKRLKTRLPKERRLEVDHIVPVFKGGQTIGHENHQAICYTCHKEKTKKDVSGKRKKLP